MRGAIAFAAGALLLLAGSARPDHVEIVSPERLGQLAMEAGLAKWVEDKVS
jgi:hypothetical protein